MEINEWKAIVLHKMGLTRPMTVREICQEHNGIQAQFQGYADEGFRTRLTQDEFESNWSKDLVRQWSIRGTVHAYLKDEIGLYLYEGRNYLKPSLGLPSRDGLISIEEKKHFADIVLEKLKTGNLEREAIKDVCRQNGLTPEKEKALFNAWGGLTASLVSEGLIYQEYGKRVFGLLDSYKPLDKNTAELEIARRYFSGFGPVSLADARYYFKEKKAIIEDWMQELDLKTIDVEGKTRFYYGDLPDSVEIPRAIFIAGFDSMLLAFEKRENPFFDPKYIRDIYTLTGILKPTIMLDGRLVATWRKEKNKVIIKPFVKLRQIDKKLIENACIYDYGIVYE